MSATKNYLMDQEQKDIARCNKATVRTPFGNYIKQKRIVKTAFGDVEYTDIKEIE